MAIEEQNMKLMGLALQVALTVLATLMLGGINDMKVASAKAVIELRQYQNKMEDYQKIMEKRVSRLEFKLYGDSYDADSNRGYTTKEN